ncbi:Curlin associated repeat-containing protein [Roseivivax halotolerans]|uniref:Curlin associated repeat-containing protein n=1 Tax=Roseivivax halotolerans TaxID=93684 RepID=A0A1I5Z359_9RHOB|nr:hypothetical protein [Roseivivax halotolerans]SFQ50909.1 Curlin associated repeat-containing protein [Roseivivax halotolerans]
MIKQYVIAAVISALTVPSLATAQEAYLAQVSVGAVSVNLPSVSNTPDITTLVAQSTTSQTGVNPATVDLSDYPLVAAPTNGAVANVDSMGDNNSAMLLQTGINAASMKQVGNWNSSTIVQSGVSNRASSYQIGDYNTAMISQTGTGNSALIIQR